MYHLNFEDVCCELKDGIASLCINRENKLNALNSSVLDHLYRFLSELEKDQSVKVIVISGAGNNAFAAGADLKEIIEKESVGECREYYLKFDRVYEKIGSMPQPVIAKVNGYAFGGGCLLALSCDLVIASKKSMFSQPEVNFGFTGGAALLPRLLGKHIASEITFLGKPFTSEDGYRWNLINKVVEENELDQEVTGICNQLLKKDPYAIAMIKRSIKNSFEVSLTAGNRYEAEVSAICLSTEKSRQQISDFVNRSNK